MSENPLRALPRGAPWQPVPMLMREGVRLAAELLGPLLGPETFDPMTGYLLARTGAALFFKPASEKAFVRQACEVYMGLFDAGMRIGAKTLMELHVLVSKDLEGAQEALFAAQSHAKSKQLNEMEKW